MSKVFLSNLDSTNYTKSSFPNERIKTMVQNRNELLIKFGKIAYRKVMQSIGIEVDNMDDEVVKMKYGDSPRVRIIGNPHQPSLVFNNKYIISVFVKNFDIYFSTDFKDGEILGSINLNTCDVECGVEEILHEIDGIVDDIIYKELYTISIDDEVYFSKFCPQGHAYFTKTNPQFYFNIEDAEEICDLLFNIGYKSVIIND